MMRFCAAHKRTHIRFAADIARVKAYLIDSVFDGGNCKPVIEMNIRHKWDPCTRADFPHGCGGRHVIDRHAHNLAACLRKLLHLRRGCLHVPRICVRHGLHGNGRACAHPYSANPYGFRFVSHF